MTALDKTVLDVTRRITRNSRSTREAYLEKIRRARERGPRRHSLSCSNLAHGFAACPLEDQEVLKGKQKPNIAIVSAYNDMLSAHQPLETYPRTIKEAVRKAGGVAQFAGGVPAMCDGVTQGEAGMELSLWSRDVIALSTAVALSHDMFDGAVCLGVCDKIVPGLLIGSLSFGHLPFVFMPAGPMPSGLSNAEKAEIRQRFAAGEISEKELLDAESAAYHSPGTCTFYGTANSNQMLMEVMGLHLPGASFENPGTPLRDALTRAAAERVTKLTALGKQYTPLGQVVDEKAIVNAIVGLLATGGSTNHTLHLVAVARAAGILIDWNDFDDLSEVIPLLTRIYPNGTADVNHFHAAGGLAFVIGELLDAGLLHGDVLTVTGKGLAAYRKRPELTKDGRLRWKRARKASGDQDILRPASEPFQVNGGLRVVDGNLGRGVVKVSSVKERHRRVEAPAMVFDSQEELQQAFKDGDLDHDLVAVVRFQGPQANGMPELHKLMPPLGVLQDRGYNVGLVTDGRLSGASGKVLSAIHVYPEATMGEGLAKVRDGDVVVIDPERGILEVKVARGEWRKREEETADLRDYHVGCGRELFATFRMNATCAEEGAVTFGDLAEAEQAPEPEIVEDDDTVLGW